MPPGCAPRDGRRSWQPRPRDLQSVSVQNAIPTNSIEFLHLTANHRAQIRPRSTKTSCYKPILNLDGHYLGIVATVLVDAALFG